MPEVNHVSRLLMLIQGAVQGIGFRPFVYRLAVDLGLCGYVANASHGVTIEVEGPQALLTTFMQRLKEECPAQAVIHDIQCSHQTVEHDTSFVIRDSLTPNLPNAVILPDLATCPDCLKEIFDVTNRRYLYPFTNCTHCGPRFSIIEKIPYDRHHTSMKGFTMCPACQGEYDNPANRRFHAQPNACPNCGPSVQLYKLQHDLVATHHNAIVETVLALQQGKIVALKGLGGFQLLVDACNDNAVALLRQRKGREEKPLALMLPSLAMIKEYCLVNKIEEKNLLSVQAPIVLLAKRDKLKQGKVIAPSVVFDNPYLGVMLPYTPLHHIIMKLFDAPLVVTSANFSDEPMCIDNDEAFNKLAAIADLFLIHDRPIVRPVDDSIGRLINNQFSITRRARGFAPLPVRINHEQGCVLALGGQLKNTVALKVNNNVYLSQHIGDLQSPQTFGAFTQSIESLRGLYPLALNAVAVDSHPDYAATRYGQDLKEPLSFIQHHHAHIAACMAEHGLNGPVLGLAWDGTGLGEDNTVWGGEFLVSTIKDFKRVGHLLGFRIPGGEASIRQPKRTALGLLAALPGHDLKQYLDLLPLSLFTGKEIDNIAHLLNKGFQSPVTTSMGRLFDGVSALLGFCQDMNYEGQAAMLLEYGIGNSDAHDFYAWRIYQDSPFSPYIIDWQPMLLEIITALRANEDKALIAGKFHRTLVEMAVDMARRVGISQVVLSGGCFQNKYLLERCINRLTTEGFSPFWHQQVPTHDGGIALGQAVITAERLCV